MLKITEKSFSSQGLQEAEDLYKRVTLTPPQRKSVNMLADILYGVVPINKLALRGFALKGIKKWQLDNKRSADELNTASPQERIEAVKEMVENTKQFLFRVMKTTEHQELITTGLNEFVKQYAKTYAQR